MATNKKSWEDYYVADDPSTYQATIDAYIAERGLTRPTTTYSYEYETPTSASSSTGSTSNGYTSSYTDMVKKLTDQYTNRGEFSYDPNTDPDYQNYLAQYTRNGETAMKNTLAQLAARTGGLASSYATEASQAAYNDYMQKAADIIPTLRQAAYEKYQQEGNDILNQLNLYNSLENQDYSRYQDQLSNDLAQEKWDYQKAQDYQSIEAQAQQYAQDEILSYINAGTYNPSNENIQNLISSSGYSQDYWNNINTAALNSLKSSVSGTTKEEEKTLDAPKYYDSKMVDRFKEEYDSAKEDALVYNKKGTKVVSEGDPDLTGMMSEIKSYVDSEFGEYDEATKENIAYSYAKSAGMTSDELDEWFGGTSTNTTRTSGTQTR